VSSSYPKFSYDQHARTCAPDDFLGQVRRTVQGVPVGEDQLLMIAEAINAGLQLKHDDVLLELACGNGALSHCLFGSCKEYVGVDISEHLISIAKQNFEALPHHRYVMRGAVEFLRDEPQPSRFSKVLCYAGLQYLSDAETAEVFECLNKKFNRVETVFLGNLPDRDRASEFYKARRPSAEELADCATAIGAWRTRSEIAELAGAAGWSVQFSAMPASFYAAHYRFDALLSRPEYNTA